MFKETPAKELTETNCYPRHNLSKLLLTGVIFTWFSQSQSLFSLSLLAIRKVSGNVCMQDYGLAHTKWTFTSFEFHMVTRLRRGWIFNDSFIAHFPQSVPVKELRKSVENLLSYWISLVYQFFWNTVHTAFIYIQHKDTSQKKSTSFITLRLHRVLSNFQTLLHWQTLWGKPAIEWCLKIPAHLKCIVNSHKADNGISQANVVNR